MAEVLDFKIRVRDDGSAVIAEFSRNTVKSADKVESAWKRIGPSIAKMTAIGATALAGLASAGVASMIAITRSTANVGDQFQKMALRTGVAVRRCHPWLTRPNYPEPT